MPQLHSTPPGPDHPVHLITIPLDAEQKALFCQLVEAFRSVPREERRALMLVKTLGATRLIHPGLGKGGLNVYDGDVAAFTELGLLRVAYGSRGTPRYDPTPLGFRYYEYLRVQNGAPLESVETSIKTFMDSDVVRTRFPAAYDAWKRAAERLWSMNAEGEATEIGHLCREAIQYVADTLVQHYRPPDVDPDPSHTVARIRAVLQARPQHGRAVAAVNAAALAYWGTLSDLVMRQEHGALKEGEALEWEDARRVVFHTAFLMYELSRVL